MFDHSGIVSLPVYGLGRDTRISADQGKDSPSFGVFAVLVTLAFDLEMQALPPFLS